MLLIADSGSTKCDWILLKDGEEVASCNTMGFNPFFHSSSLIAEALSQNTDLSPYRSEVKSIYFYGAGCSGPEFKNIVHQGLSAVFPQASITIHHDLSGAAYATWNGSPGISCILGTGSNACFFDGEAIYQEVPALGYILGDEGSGSYFGKLLLSSFLYKQLPSHIHRAFVERFALSKEVIMENVYRKPHANVYLASFTKFFSRFKDDPWVTDKIRVGLGKFLEIHVCCFKNHREVPVHFVGSIGHYFAPHLREEANLRKIHLGRIVKKPITGLVDYHLKQEVKY